MANPGLPIYLGIVPILALLVIHFVISFISIRSIKLRELISGKPSILINRGRIDEKELIKENFTINELQERLRGQNIFDLGNVEYAILETSRTIKCYFKTRKKSGYFRRFAIKFRILRNSI